METTYETKELRKFTKSFDLSDYQILTDTGFVDVEYLHETIPYEVWELKLENGMSLECADDHIVFLENGDEVFVKNLKVGDSIITDSGNSILTSVQNLGRLENMYDFELSENSNRRYYTNGILSHNTELAKQLARYLFDSDDSLIRIDMSEYGDKYTVSKILGSPQGYVGYDDTNVLDRIRRKPYSVILFDEIEKAHPDVFNIFLQMLDDGQMTDSQGRKVSFKNCVILMTSNVGTRVVKDFGAGVGFATTSKIESKESNVKSILEKELKKKFAPEFINRIDGIIYFKDLGKDEIMKIVTLELDKTLKRAEKLGYTLSIDEKLKDHLTTVGFDPQFGARPLKRAIQRWIDDSVTEYIMNNSPKIGSTLLMTYDSENDITSISEKKSRSPRKPKE